MWKLTWYSYQVKKTSEFPTKNAALFFAANGEADGHMWADDLTTPEGLLIQDEKFRKLLRQYRGDEE